MQVILDRFTTALGEIMKEEITVIRRGNGVMELSSEKMPMRLWLYPDHVSDRATNSDSIKTIHIDVHVLTNDMAKVLARIRTIAGCGRRLYARQTVVARVDKRITLAFLTEHHLQTAMPGKYRYGLYFDGELVSIAVFSGGRRMQGQPEHYRSFELIRFCHKRDFIAIGGLSKLIAAFRKDFNPGDLMTYVDRDWSQDSSLQQIGFKEEGTLAPQSITFNPMVSDLLSEETERLTISKMNSGSTKLVLRFANSV
ncbi:hypothetical protein M8998_09850 [Sphingobacterium sp. lm-10]|uniref:hypothetical protein n=1 Tax=Sphingobacterium sp. lm-10 TaxID=2944904 RepID=UPI00202114DF|nr:hypothetical protein [Sphingobacterium sp. lm-10]MCL7988239.1 hypothetical protein [Sphingobacterium sp. lm-10]